MCACAPNCVLVAAVDPSPLPPQHQARRESWEKEKERAIRAMTIKSLEPEVNRMIQQRKEDMRKAKERLQEELTKQADVYEGKLREARAATGATADQAVSAAVTRERESALEQRQTLVQQHEEAMTVRGWRRSAVFCKLTSVPPPPHHLPGGSSAMFT